MSGFSDVKKIFGGGTTSTARQAGILLSLVAIVLVFQFWTNGLTLTPGNLIAVVNQYSYILILAIGMVMVIIAGHIDLSVGSVAAFTGIIVAKAMADFDLPWPLAIVLGLVVGALIGAWQGFWVAYVGVPAFIVTLAGMLIFRGGNQYIGAATAVPVPEGFTVIGAGYLPEIGPDTGYNNLTLILGFLAVVAIAWREWRSRRTQAEMGSEMVPVWVSIARVVIIGAVVLYAAFLFAGGRVGTSFPVSGLILVALVVAYSFLTRNTIIGRHIYAVGGNSHAAELSGVKSKRVNFFVMMNMSILAGLAGMIFIARAGASGGQDGNGWELDAIAAAFIGGTAVAGGVGTVIGAIIGGLVMAFLNNGLQLVGAGADLVQIVKGLVLLLAVAIDVYNRSQGRFSIIGIFRPKRRNGPSDQTPTPTTGTPDTAKPGAVTVNN
ncbi:sugar ABC transporter permease [Labedella populi]|uniref:Xylose transport system permease protein XylH n=1 Tax=Labedella populi TaxID=2498850 RepID=A0A444QFJ7_9MICO|nr:multiple monosaccharide ABC transporter permease [Labedella populi]RWZ68387.1 sugar ABC transporter permease [Labedella populi]